MNNRFIHIISGFLALLLILPVLLPMLTLIQHRYNQWEMMEQLEQKELITIEVTTSAIVWVEAGKECFINGALFDVKHYEYNGEKYTLCGLFDRQEKAIQQSIYQQTEERHNPEQTTRLIKLLTTTSILQQTTYESDCPFVFLAEGYAKYSNPFYTDPIATLLTPPPRSASFTGLRIYPFNLASS